MPGSSQTSNGRTNNSCQALPCGPSCSDLLAENPLYEYHRAEADRLRQEALALPWYSVNARLMLIRQAWDHVDGMMEALLPELRKTYLASTLSK